MQGDSDENKTVQLNKETTMSCVLHTKQIQETTLTGRENAVEHIATNMGSGESKNGDVIEQNDVFSPKTG